MPPIDLEKDGEQLLTLVQASKVLPRKPTYKTLRSWAELGRTAHRSGKKVFLGIIQVGGLQYTSRKAYDEFIKELNDEGYVDEA